VKHTLIVSAFPGTGKTYLFNNPPEGTTLLDSDSSQFSWTAPGVKNPEFPVNYIKHIKANLGKVDYILVSSHQEVRDALTQGGINFTVVFPSLESKAEYVQRYIQRGSPDSFVRRISENWDTWVNDKPEVFNFVELAPGEYLSDVLGSPKFTHKAQYYLGDRS